MADFMQVVTAIDGEDGAEQPARGIAGTALGSTRLSTPGNW